MPDAVELVKLFKQTAADTMEAMKPVNVLFGEVDSVSPLQISVEQKLKLGENQLVLARNVTDFATEVTVSWDTEEAEADMEHGHESSISVSVNSEVIPEETEITIENTVDSNVSVETAAISFPHSHEISGRKKITVHNGLAVGDKVILIRQQEGQKYFVLDRVGG